MTYVYNQGGDTRTPFHGDSLDTFQNSLKNSVGDWPKSCLFMYKHICAYFCINTKDLSTLIFAKLDFITDCSASINQFFNTKNSFLQLSSRKATLKCEVSFKSVFFTNFFT